MTKRNAIILFGPIERERHELLAAILTQLTLFVKNPTVIDFYKKGKLLKLLYTKDIKNVHVRKVDFDKYKDWDELEDNAELVMRQFRNVFIFCLPCVDGFNYKDISLVKDFEKKKEKDNLYSFNSHGIGNLYKRIVFIKHCTQNIRCIHLLLDPREAFLDRCWNFRGYKRFYFMNGLDGSEYFPYFEYGLISTYCQYVPPYNNLFFIGSCNNSEKDYLRLVVDKLGTLLERSLKWRAYSKKCVLKLFNKNDKFCRLYQNEYYYELMLARYTIIPRTYYGNSFNYIRFIEAIMCNCVPLILPDVYMEDLKLTFKDMYDIIIKRNLLLSYREIIKLGKSMLQKRLKSYDDDKICIDEIKNTDSWKVITDANFIKQMFDNLLGVRNV